jgi:hypothetical protein
MKYIAIGILALSLSGCVLEGDGCRFEGRTRPDNVGLIANCPNAGGAIIYISDGEHHGLYSVGRAGKEYFMYSVSTYEPNPYEQGR